MGNSSSSAKPSASASASASAAAATPEKAGGTKRKAEESPAPKKEGEGEGEGEGEEEDEQPPAKKAKKTKAADKKKGKKGVVVAPCTWEEFQTGAQPLQVKVGDSEVCTATVKHFATGSFGWYFHGNRVLKDVAGKAVAARIGLNITVLGSKNVNSKTANKDGSVDEEEEDGKESGASEKTDEKFKELSKAECPFDPATFMEEVKELSVTFSAADSRSLNPFEVSAKPKPFATGSLGWGHHKNQKILAATDASHGLSSLTVRIQLNITVANSKPAKKPASKAKSKAK